MGVSHHLADKRFHENDTDISDGSSDAEPVRGMCVNNTTSSAKLKEHQADITSKAAIITHFHTG